MKLRIRLGKRTEKVEVSGEDTVVSLKQKVASSFGISIDSFQLSLNGKDAVDAADSSLVSALGVVSGDLLKLITDKGSSSPSVQPSSSSGHSGKTSSCAPDSEAAVKVEGHSSQACQADASSSTDEQARSDSDQGSTVVEEWDTEPLFVSGSHQGRIPIRLRQIWETNGPQGSDETLALVLHSLMLETGFTLRSQDEVAGTSGILPPTWRDSGCFRLSYSHKQCDQSHVCHMACVPMGPIVVVTGIVSHDKKSSFSFQLTSTEYVKEWRNGLSLSNTAKLSRVFKDTIAHPMMNTMRENCGLTPAHGLLAVAVELQLKVMTYLDVRSILNLSEVCHSLNNLAQDETLWHHLCLRDKKVGPRTTGTSSSWKNMYKRAYREEVERKRAEEECHRQAMERWRHPHFTPAFPGEYPGPFPGIRGGDYDLDPFSVHPPGMPRPGPLRPPGIRPRYDPIFPGSDLDPQSGPGRGLMDRTGRGPRDGPPGGRRIGFRGGGGSLGFFM